MPALLNDLRVQCNRYQNSRVWTVVVTHTDSPNTQEAGGPVSVSSRSAWTTESSRTTKSTQRNLVSKTNQNRRGKKAITKLRNLSYVLVLLDQPNSILRLEAILLQGQNKFFLISVKLGFD